MMIRKPKKRRVDRRQLRRIPCKTPVRVYTDQGRVSDSYTLMSADLSQDGVFLRSDYLYPVGEELDLEYVVPGQPVPVRGRASVVRVATGQEQPGPGMAVRLRDATPSQA